MKYKVYTQWIGESVIELESESKQAVKEIIRLRPYDFHKLIIDEASTNDGLHRSHLLEQEKIIKIEEII